MKSVERDDGWWITDTPEGVDEMGPYDNKKDADEDRRGVQRSLDELEKMNARNTRNSR